MIRNQSSVAVLAEKIAAFSSTRVIFIFPNLTIDSYHLTSFIAAFGGPFYDKPQTN
jgi:hypothetical protein